MSELTQKLKPLEECIRATREECEKGMESAIQNYKERLAKKIEKIERNRPVAALLDAAGFDITTYYWGHGEEFYVKLGFFPSTPKGSRQLAGMLRDIREILGSKLGLPDKDLEDDAKKGSTHVRFTLNPPEYPGIEIRYTRKLPKGAKCKIVTSRSTYRRLVCEV